MCVCVCRFTVRKTDYTVDKHNVRINPGICVYLVVSNRAAKAKGRIQEIGWSVLLLNEIRHEDYTQLDLFSLRVLSCGSQIVRLFPVVCRISAFQPLFF